ncbi:MAG: magnesium chelatase domain-containing protein, partial [Anaerolineae bacterium]
DIFVSVAGGIRIVEPGVDLGLLLAIASSFCSKALDPDMIIIGEVGLSGEVRSVSRLESRIKEAAHLGFRRGIIPKRSLKGLSQELFSKIDLHGVEFVEEALDALIR